MRWILNQGILVLYNRHEAIIECKDKILHFTDDDKQRKSLGVKPRGVPKVHLINAIDEI